MGLGRLRWFAGTSLVDGSHAEFVLRSLDEVVDFATICVTIDFRALLPSWTVFVTFFYDVASDW